MRRGRGYWAFSAVACVLAAIVVACSGDDTSNGSNDADGGGADGGSNVDSTTGDGSGGDASKGPGPLTITLIDNYGVPVANGKVVAYDASGTPQAPVTSGADGKVTVTVGASGWSLAASYVRDEGNGTRTTLTSILGVEPGDDLVAYVISDIGPASVAVVSIDPPTGSPGSGTNFQISDGCEETTFSTGTFTLPVTPGCTHTAADGGSAVDLFFTAFDSSGSLVAYAQKTEVAAFTGSTATGAAWTAVGQRAVSVAGSAPGVDRYNFSVAYAAHGISYGSAFIPSLAPDASLSGITLPVANGSFVDSYTVRAGASFPSDSAGKGIGTGESVTVPSDGGFAVDFSRFAPKIHDAVPTSNDAGTYSLTFQAATPLTDLVGETATLYYHRPSEAGDEDRVDWTIIAPSGTTISPPPITPDLAPFVPSTDALVLDLVGMKSSSLPDYAAYRHAASRLNYEVRSHAAPPPGDTTFTTGIFGGG